MRKSGMNRMVAVVAAVFVGTGAVMVTAGAAWSAPGHAAKAHTTSTQVSTLSAHAHGHAVKPSVTSTHSILRIDDAAGLVELIIPTPACPESNLHCEWMLLINEPELPGQPVVGSVTGTSGVLTLAFPKFCGVIQADSLIGPAPWMRTHGVRRRLDTCTTPTTTTSTTKPTSSTTKPPATTTTTTTKPPQVAAASTTPTTSALPFTAATSASPTTSSPHVAAAAQLPFTGLDIKPLILLGSVLILFGGLLLTTVESRRRALQRASAIRLEHVKEGTRRTSSWFLGL
jgi:hypothetical protein